MSSRYLPAVDHLQLFLLQEYLHLFLELKFLPIQYGYNAPAKQCGRIRMVRISDIHENIVIWNNATAGSLALEPTIGMPE